jgi:hypothetical protein
MPNGNPKYIRCYDNQGETADRYTVVYIGIDDHVESDTQIDYPYYSHLGKKIKFEDLPEDYKTLVVRDYVYLWDLKEHPLYREN